MYSLDQYELINPETNGLAFKIGPFDHHSFAEIQRLPYYTVAWIHEGEVLVKTDFSITTMKKDQVLFFSPYQPFSITGKTDLKGEVFHFHSDFYCIYQYDNELGCNGVLYNNIYEPNYIQLDENSVTIFENLFYQLKEEMRQQNLSQHQMLTSQLKMLLIHSVRIKASQNKEFAEGYRDQKEPFILKKLKDYIEEHFRHKHSPNEYADLLNITAKHLGKITKSHFDKTPTELISERIMMEAKRDLYLTDKPIKEMAYDLGFNDEYHFSKYFKSRAGVSPQGYRDNVGFDALTKIQ